MILGKERTSKRTLISECSRREGLLDAYESRMPHSRPLLHRRNRRFVLKSET